MRNHILSILCWSFLACSALAFPDTPDSWGESERAYMQAVAEANRPAAPLPSPDIWPLVLLLALLLAVSAPGLAALTRAGLDAARAFGRDTTRPAFLAGLLLVTAAVYSGASKFPTNPVLEMIGDIPDAMEMICAPPAQSSSASATSTPASLAAGGLALVSATNAVPGWWERPAWADAYSPWSQYGVHEDFIALRLADTAAPSNTAFITLAAPPFPVGTNTYGRLYISSCGAVSFGRRYRLWPDTSPVPDGSDAPLFAVLRGPLGLAPGVGAFWYGSLSNRILLTWQDVYLGRDSNLTASAQAALEPTGDFLLRVKLPASGPVNPDTDGDGAADSLDPQPLIFTTDTVLACCTNTWLFHVQNGLAVDGTSCQLAGDAEAWRSERFPVTVTLNAAVPPPGAVLRIGTLPLILREPGTHTLWLPRSSAWHVRLCRQWDFPVDYSLTSPEPGFIFEPAGAQPPAYSGIRYEGVMAVPSPLTVQPANACFHGKPVTFTATGPSTGLSGTYIWQYGSVRIETNAPAATFAPDSAFPDSVSVTFMPDLAQPPPQSGGFMMLAANADGWPTGGTGPCGYCNRHRAHETQGCECRSWCEKTGTDGSGCTNGPAYIPPADGTNSWVKSLAVNHRDPAPVWPRGGVSLRPAPRGHNGYTVPAPAASDAEWMGDHFHYSCTDDHHSDDDGPCCSCPEHNAGGGSPSTPPDPRPVLFQSADGVAVANFLSGGGTSPLATGGQVPGGVYVTGQTPSTSPLDREAVFTRYDPENHETYYEYDRFTVMSLDLWPDVSCDGNFGSEDHSAITLDWSREWLIPVNADAWRMICFFNDVAMPGIYTVTVTGSTNIIARYGDTCVRGGESGEVAFPQQGQSDERIDVQAAGPGAATLTVTFTGTGVAEGCTCSTYVNITAWDVGLGMDADYDGDIDAQDDPLEETQGGLTAVGESTLTPLDIAFSAAGTSSGTLTLEALSGGDKIRIRTGNTTNSAAISLPKTWAAGETIPSRIWVQGLSHSDISRDVSLRLTGSLQGVVCEDTVSLTVVQIESETVAELPRNRLRKTIGVGEEVKLTLLPATIGTVTWNISAGTGQLGSSVPVIFTAPSEADTATVTATINGCECETVFEIIAPTGIRMENHEVQTALFGVSQGIAWMGLQYWGTYYVQPDTVNFYNIQLYEGASDVHTNGYFSLFLSSIAKPHDVNGPHVLSSALVEGKGTPGTINDQIGGTIDIYPSSLEGDLYWDIEWSYAIGTEAKKEIAILRQCFHINYVNGTPKLTVTKGLSGYWMLNGTNEAFPVDSQ